VIFVFEVGEGGKAACEIVSEVETLKMGLRSEGILTKNSAFQFVTMCSEIEALNILHDASILPNQTYKRHIP